MSKLEAAIAHIEAVTGQDFGEKPREITREEQKELCKNTSRTKKRILKILSWFIHFEDNYESRYLPLEHAIVINPKDEERIGELVRIHECGHAFQKNKWPEISEQKGNKENNFVRECIQEGIAEYVTAQYDGEISRQALSEERGELKTRETTKYYLDEYRDQSKQLDYLAYSNNIRALGLALAEAAVEQAGDVWTGLDNLAKNPPQTINEAYDLIEVARDA